MKENLKLITEYYGKKAQVLQAIEEMSELTKELLKDVNRGKPNYNEIVGEIADVDLMLDQLKMIYKIKPSTINNIKENKISIVLGRMKNE